MTPIASPTIVATAQSHANLDAAEIGPAEKVEIDAAAAAPSMFTFGAGS